VAVTVQGLHARLMNRLALLLVRGPAGCLSGATPRWPAAFRPPDGRVCMVAFVPPAYVGCAVAAPIFARRSALGDGGAGDSFVLSRRGASDRIGDDKAIAYWAPPTIDLVKIDLYDIVRSYLDLVGFMKTTDLCIILAVAAVLLPTTRARRRRRSLPYELYINSPLWQLRRRLWIHRAGGCCQRCGSPRQLTIHHQTYARLGRERREDIRVLCWSCHQREHLRRRMDGSTYARDANR
jgi:hypothetical protein